MCTYGPRENREHAKKSLASDGINLVGSSLWSIIDDGGIPSSTTRRSFSTTTVIIRNLGTDQLIPLL